MGLPQLRLNYGNSKLERIEGRRKMYEVALPKRVRLEPASERRSEGRTCCIPNVFVPLAYLGRMARSPTCRPTVWFPAMAEQTKRPRGSEPQTEREKGEHSR